MCKNIRKRKTLILSVAGVILIAVSVGAFLYMNKKDNEMVTVIEDVNNSCSNGLSTAVNGRLTEKQIKRGELDKYMEKAKEEQLCVQVKE